MADQYEKRRVKSLLQACGNAWHVERHEDRIKAGIPDLSFGCAGFDGWIEVKAAPHRVINDELTAPLRHFTPDQCRWLTQRWMKGSGAVWLYFEVASHDHYLIHPSNPLLGRLVGRHRVKMHELELADHFLLDTSHGKPSFKRWFLKAIKTVPVRGY